MSKLQLTDAAVILPEVSPVTQEQVSEGEVVCSGLASRPECLPLAPSTATGSWLRLGAWQGVERMATRGHLRDHKTSQTVVANPSRRDGLRWGLNKEV